MYKVVNEKVAVPADYLNLSSKDSNRNSKHNQEFRIPPAKTGKFRFFFFIRTVAEWNVLTNTAVAAGV